MNKERRSELGRISVRLDEIKKQIEDIAAEEREAIDGTPESLRGAKHGDDGNTGADGLETVASYLEGAVREIGTAVSIVNEVISQ